MSFKVKALFAYSSEHDDDLGFDEGQIISITEDDDEDWYTGEYVEEGTGSLRSGLFPRNFVERYEPVTPPRPARRPQAAAATVPAPVPVPVPVPEPASPTAPTVPPSQNTAAETHSDSESEEEIEPPPTSQKTDQLEEKEDRGDEDDDDDNDDDDDDDDEAGCTARPVPPAPVTATKPSAPPAPHREVVTSESVATAKAPSSPPDAGRSSAQPTAEAASKPPVASKPTGNSFKDRIAAFNRGGAAPIAPPKPGGLYGGPSSNFIKKAYVPPPPSRNAYVPPTTQAPVAKVYRREEDPEFQGQGQGQGENERTAPVAEKSEEPEEEQAKPMSLKERMAMLQKQQLEQQARNADAAAKKAKPKPPPKKSSSSSQPPIPMNTPGGVADSSGESADAPPVPTRVLTQGSEVADPVASPEQEIAEPSLAADENHERVGAQPALPQRIPEASPDERAEIEAEEEEEEDEEQEEVDPEIRRRMEIRERMAKMSGGMGMGAMFGGAPGLPGMGARKPPKPASTESSVNAEEASTSEVGTSPVPVMPGMAMPGMALPGMGLPRVKKQEHLSEEPETLDEEDEDGDEQETATRTTTNKSDVAPIRRSMTLEEPHEATSAGASPLSESRPAPPVPVDNKPTKRQSMDSTNVAPVPHDAPPVPLRASTSPVLAHGDHASESPSSPKGAAPPIPNLPPPQRRFSRGPPPPPPSQPPRPSMDAQRPQELDENEETDEDDDTDEKLSQSHTSLRQNQIDEQKSRTSEDLHHAGLPSLGPESHPRAVPPPPPPSAAQATSPREPPPLPSLPPRQSCELPRAPPPVPPPTVSPPVNDDYDPFNYQANPLGVSTRGRASSPKPEVSHDDLYDASPTRSPVSRAPPPLPVQIPVQSDYSTAPPAQPPSIIPTQARSPQLFSPAAPVAAPPVPLETRQSLDVPNVAQNRRSIDGSRLSSEQHDFIAADVDLGRDSSWWVQRRSAPPVFQNRGDVRIEFDESTTVQGDGRALTAKRVYVLFMDYSQTIVTAYFQQDSPANGAELQQRHEPPPARLRQDQLETAHAQFGARLAQAAKSKENHAVGDGSALALVSELIKSQAGALGPVGNRAFGALVYSNLANATVQQHDEIRAGDVVSFRNARLQGHRGGLKQKYQQDLPAHTGFVLDWDGTKQKLRIYEQNGKKVKLESYKLGDLKTGEAKVWRVMSRDWIGWGSI